MLQLPDSSFPNLANPFAGQIEFSSYFIQSKCVILPNTPYILMNNLYKNFHFYPEID